MPSAQEIAYTAVITELDAGAPSKTIGFERAAASLDRKVSTVTKSFYDYASTQADAPVRPTARRNAKKMPSKRRSHTLQAEKGVKLILDALAKAEEENAQLRLRLEQAEAKARAYDAITAQAVTLAHSKMKLRKRAKSS